MESIEKKGLFNEVNALINRLKQDEMMKYFFLDGYIRINGFFISPFSLVSIRRGLKDFILSWELSETGWKISFKNEVYVHFKGTFTSQIKEGKIMNIKIDSTKPEYNSAVHYDILLRYLKSLDTFYFMLTDVEKDFELLSNPLGSALGWNLEDKKE